MERARLRRYLRHGTLPQLAAFEATVRLGSCSKAAEALHQSQPTVSIHLKKLSESLGTALFERDGRGLRLTPAGREVYATCRELFASFEALDARLSQSVRECQGDEAPLAPVAVMPARPAPQAWATL